MSIVLFYEKFNDEALDNGESRPAELPHQSLAELCMNLSAHTAPII